MRAAWSSDPDRALQSASGGDVKVMIGGDSGRIYWKWIHNDTGYDCHATCMIQATGPKTSADHTV